MTGLELSLKFRAYVKMFGEIIDSYTRNLISPIVRGRLTLIPSVSF